METLNFEQCNCPFCLANDRERLYAIFLDEYWRSRLNGLQRRILDFAPTPAFSKRMRALKNVAYASADLTRADVDVNIDACDMKEIDDGSYDVIIFSHVLEHVSNASAALGEIRRILSAEGIAIIMVPLFYDVKSTVENSEYDTPQLRLKHYGQDDHIRLYSRQDFLRELEQAQFTVTEWGVSRFDPGVIRRNAIAKDSVLYVVDKRHK